MEIPLSACGSRFYSKRQGGIEANIVIRRSVSLPKYMEHWEIQQLQSPLLKHLLSSHISLRTPRYKLAPTDALQIAGCSSCIVIESFPSYNPPPTTTSPTAHVAPLSSPRPPMLLLALHPIAVLRYQSTTMRLAPASSSSQTTPRRPCPGATPQQRWPGCHAGRADGQTGRQTDRHAAM